MPEVPAAAIELGLQQSSSLRMEREWDERRKGGDDVGHVDKTRLRECVERVRAEVEKLAAAGFGYKESDADGVYGTVRFKAKFKGEDRLAGGGGDSQRSDRDAKEKGERPVKKERARRAREEMVSSEEDDKARVQRERKREKEHRRATGNARKAVLKPPEKSSPLEAQPGVLGRLKGLIFGSGGQ